MHICQSPLVLWLGKGSYLHMKKGVYSGTYKIGMLMGLCSTSFFIYSHQASHIYTAHQNFHIKDISSDQQEVSHFENRKCLITLQFTQMLAFWMSVEKRYCLCISVVTIPKFWVRYDTWLNYLDTTTQLILRQKHKTTGKVIEKDKRAWAMGGK